MGVRSTSWGGPLWHASFCMAINYNEHPSPNKKQIYLEYFDLLGKILPCSFCRVYYEKCKVFLSLEQYIDDPSIDYPVMYWLYLLKDLVNQKLMKQESECFDKESKKIEDNNSLSDRAKSYRKSKLRTKIFYTKPSPPFHQVLAFYHSLRSSCETNDINKSLQSCRHIPIPK